VLLEKVFQTIFYINFEYNFELSPKGITTKIIRKMKNTINALVVLSVLAITTTSFAQSKEPNSAIYKQQNQLLGRKPTASAPAQVQLNNYYSTNPQANHRNYKTQGSHKSLSKTIVVAVNNDDKLQNYKQKNLLTKSGRDARNKKMNKVDSILISQNQFNKKE